MKIFFKNDYEAIENMRHEYFANLAEWLVLDVGCAQLWNVFFKKNPKISKVVGIDISDPEEHIYDSYFKINLDKEGIPLEPTTIDTIVAGEVLEHLENPIENVRRFHSLLKDDGKLLISIPNSMYFGEIIRRLLWVNAPEDKEHLYLHDKMSFRNILTTNGFEVEKILGYRMRIPLLKWHFVSFKLPLFFSYHIVYICKKK